jgi:hypothetical protein
MDYGHVHDTGYHDPHHARAGPLLCARHIGPVAPHMSCEDAPRVYQRSARALAEELIDGEVVCLSIQHDDPTPQEIRAFADMLDALAHELRVIADQKERSTP